MILLEAIHTVSNTVKDIVLQLQMQFREFISLSAFTFKGVGSTHS